MSQPTSLPEMPSSAVAVLPPPPKQQPQLVSHLSHLSHLSQQVQSHLPHQQLYHHEDPHPQLVNISSSPARLPIFYRDPPPVNNISHPNNANSAVHPAAQTRQNNEYLADELAIHFAESPVRSFANLEIQHPQNSIDPVGIVPPNHHPNSQQQHAFRNAIVENSIPDIQLVANQQNIKNNTNGNAGGNINGSMNRSSKSIPAVHHIQPRKNEEGALNSNTNNGNATAQGINQLPPHHFQNTSSPPINNINMASSAAYPSVSAAAGNLLQQRIHPPPVTTRHLASKRPKLLPTNPIRSNSTSGRHQSQHQANTLSNNLHRNSKQFGTGPLPYSLAMSPQDAASAAAARFAFSAAQAAAPHHPAHQLAHQGATSMGMGYGNNNKQKMANGGNTPVQTQNFGIASPPLPQPSYRYSFPLIASQGHSNNNTRGLYLPNDKQHPIGQISHPTAVSSLDYHHATPGAVNTGATLDQASLPNINIANSNANCLDEKLLAAAGIPAIAPIASMPGSGPNASIMRSSSPATASINRSTSGTTPVRTKLTCPHATCGKEYTRSHALNVHISTKHTGTNQEYQCTTCGKVFNRKDTLKRHFATTHQMLRNWPCKQCSRRFGQQAHLNTHVRTVHGKDRPHSCDQCPKSFGTLYNLNAHKNTHKRTQKAYACEVCRKTYKIKSSLARHKRKEKHMTAAELAAMNNQNNHNGNGIPNHQINDAIIDNTHHQQQPLRTPNHISQENTFRHSSTSSITDPNTTSNNNISRRYSHHTTYQPHQAHNILHDPHQSQHQQQSHQLEQSNNVSATSRRNP